MQIPIVFCADKKYGAYLCVALQSIIENSSAEHEYHIIIFDCGISAVNWAGLERQIACRQNFQLRRENINAWLSRYKTELRARNYWSPAMFGHFLIPELCAAYEKTIYADVDMVFNRDLAELYQLDLSGKMLGAIIDDEMEWAQRHNRQKQRYRAEILGLSEENFYVNSGLLVYNNRLWAETKTIADLPKLLAERELKLPDQDAVNILCKGKIHYLSPVWNMLSQNKQAEQRQALYPFLWAEWQRGFAVAVKNIHYNAPIKPWHDAASPYAALWWAYARRTEFYEAFLVAAALNQAGLNLASAPVSYRLLGMALLCVKIRPYSKKYYLFGKTWLKIAELRHNPQYGGIILRLFELNLLSRDSGA